MLRFSSRLAPTTRTTVATTTAAITTSLLFSQSRTLKVVPRQSFRQAAATRKQTLKKPANSAPTPDNNNSDSNNNDNPNIQNNNMNQEGAMFKNTINTATTIEETTVVIDDENTSSSKSSSVPKITMPSHQKSSDNKKNSASENTARSHSQQQQQQPPLVRLLEIIRLRIAQQEEYEENQISMKRKQEDNNNNSDDKNSIKNDVETQGKSDVSAKSTTTTTVKFNRYSTSNYASFATTAEEIIREFRRTFKLPTIRRQAENDNEDTVSAADHHQRQQQSNKVIMITDGSSTNGKLENHNDVSIPIADIPTSSLSSHQKRVTNDMMMMAAKQQQSISGNTGARRVKKLFPSTPFGGKDSNNNNSLSVQNQQNDNNNNNNVSNNNRNSSPNGLLAQYCGSSGDVLQLAMIVMQSCVDVCEIDTARLLFALVLQEVPFHAIPFQFFRLYFLALSRSETVTFQEFNTLVELVGGMSVVRRNCVMSLCVLEVKMKCGFSVSIEEVKQALRASMNNENEDENDEHKKQTFFMMTEDSEKRLKLRDLFLVSLRSHPDLEVPTLLLKEWTKLSDLTEFVGEKNTIVSFLIAAVNNNTATSAALCAELIVLLESLVKHSNNSSDDDNNNMISTTTTTKQQQQELLTLKTMMKCLAKATRSKDWTSFLIIEKFTREIYFISSEEEQKQQQQSQEDRNRDDSTTTSPEVQAVLSSVCLILRKLAMIETNKIQEAAGNNEMWFDNSNNNNKNDTDCDVSSFLWTQIIKCATIAPLTFLFRKIEDLESNINPFYVDQLITSSSSNTKRKRLELAKLVNFPLADYPPMTMLFEKLVNDDEDVEGDSNTTSRKLLKSYRQALDDANNHLEQDNNKNKLDFVSTLILLTSLIKETTSSISQIESNSDVNTLVELEEILDPFFNNNSNNNRSTSTSAIIHNNLYTPVINLSLSYLRILGHKVKESYQKQQQEEKEKEHEEESSMEKRRQIFEDAVDYLQFEVVEKYLTDDLPSGEKESETFSLKKWTAAEVQKLLKEVTGREMK